MTPASLERRIVSKVFHAIPGFRGRGRILKLINRVFHVSGGVRGHGALVIAEMKLGHRMFVDLRSDTEFQAYYTGDYDTQQMREILSLVEPGWQVLDVGANIGFYTAALARRIGSIGGRVTSFEPVPSNFNRLLQNVRLNGLDDSVTLVNLGLSNQPGTATITLREDFVLGSETGNAAILIEDGQDHRFRTANIPLETLDRFVQQAGLRRVDFIKVDIEGHEDCFLEGGLKTVAEFRPILQMELNEDYFRRRQVDLERRMAELLNGLNYVYLAKLEGRWRPIDRLAKRSRKRSYGDDFLLVPSEAAQRVIERVHA